MKKYRDWDLLEVIPEGWKIDKTVGTPVHGYEFCTNGKGVINGQKRALIKSAKIKIQDIDLPRIEIAIVEPKKSTNKNLVIDKTQTKTVNELARKKMMEKLLKDIRVDLMICELENWDKKEYLNALQKLINSIG